MQFTEARWVMRPAAPRAHRVRVFCFPHAGGGPVLYQPWWKTDDAHVECWPVQLPGRGPRLHEPQPDDLGTLVDALAAALPLDDAPFAFFGHSWGAILAFELSRTLAAAGRVLPRHLFASAAAAPTVRRRDRLRSDLPDAELVAELRRLRGTPAEILAEPDLLALLLPALRADLRLAESFAPGAAVPLPLAISVFAAEGDELVDDDLLPWREHAAHGFALQWFPGDHFYLTEQRGRVLAAMSAALR